MEATRTHDHRRLDPVVGEPSADQGKRLARDGLRGLGTEGVARHADMPEVEPAGERMAGLAVPGLELVEHPRHVPHAKLEVFQRRRLPHRRHPAGERFVPPHRRVAARVLEEHGHIAPCRPMLGEESWSLARTAQAVAEEHDGERLGREG